MDFKFSKDSDEQQLQAVAPEKKSQGALAVLLVILVGGFSYLYFFTDLIRPQSGGQPVPAPAAAPQVVKLPLPPRAGDVAADAVKKPEPPKEVAAPQPAPKTTAPPVVASAPVAPPVAKPASKVVPPPAKPADKKALPTPPAAKQEHATAAASAVPAAVGSTKKTAAPPLPAKPVTVVKAVVIPQPVARADAKHAKSDHESVASTDEGIWSVLVGNYVLEETLSADMGRVRKAGLVPVVKSAARKKSQMNRLLLSEFSDRAAARAAFEKLKTHTSDAFILEKGGTYSVYAGSYLLTERVASEKERLQAEGFPVTLQHSEVSIPAQSLTVGPFTSKKAAAAAVKTLKGAGIKASLSRH
ncbi:MAG TPA: hypothetical protein HPP94_08355 [Desulfuromonadales bacterium]|nr:hypothetical protein [Desulfuromonadales bacterium]